ncbi:hypothetical protein [Synechococcus sp. CS-1328]|uniref:hypothetical protein n=1 Tax=Synechococcus sp. CS-1328 TaxID=2847976 RepID=UPI00223C372D|nr:hypothetical protein [Synechococcus sp. CS-1328]MCT0225328.1 hypothetical protein [Synechococcus sp. CS-1328]
MGYRDKLGAGRAAFAHLIKVWHERNDWSHRVLPGLAEALDLGKVHNSQISMLRNGKLASPGPEVFLALGSVNQWLAAQPPGQPLTADLRQLLLDTPEALEALAVSAQPVTDPHGGVLGPGELLEVFVGVRQPPPAFDLRIADAEAAGLSAALALLFTAGQPWRQCRTQLLEAYPVARRQRRERFAEVMAGQSDYNASELDAELPDLRRTLAALGVAGEQELSADQFLELLRDKARQQRIGMNGRSIDLAAAIRRELGTMPGRETGSGEA